MKVNEPIYNVLFFLLLSSCFLAVQHQTTKNLKNETPQNLSQDH